jgi:hypothetical protein
MHILIHSSFCVWNNTLLTCRPEFAEVAWTIRKAEQTCHRNSILIHTLPNLSDCQATGTRVCIVVLPRIESSIPPTLHFRHHNERGGARWANYIEQQRLQTVFVKHKVRNSIRKPNILTDFRQCLQINGWAVNILGNYAKNYIFLFRACVCACLILIKNV